MYFHIWSLLSQAGKLNFKPAIDPFFVLLSSFVLMQKVKWASPLPQSNTSEIIWLAVAFLSIQMFRKACVQRHHISVSLREPLWGGTRGIGVWGHVRPHQSGGSGNDSKTGGSGPQMRFVRLQPPFRPHVLKKLSSYTTFWSSQGLGSYLDQHLDFM